MTNFKKNKATLDVLLIKAAYSNRYSHLTLKMKDLKLYYLPGLYV